MGSAVLGGNTAPTTTGALAAGAVVPPAISALVTLVTTPCVDDVIVVTMVQPPGGIALPVAIVISVGATVTPGQLPRLPLVTVTPAGMGSVNGAVRTKGVAFGLPSVSVSVAVPPSGMLVGTMLFVIVALSTPLTEIGAEAAGAVPPPLVCSGLVTLVTVPDVAVVMVTTIVQPPAGIVLPAAIVISAGATVTPAQVPLLRPMVVTPAGIGSVNAADSVSGSAPGFPSVIVSVAVPPAAIVAGAMVLASVTLPPVTVIGAEAGGTVPPPPICNGLVTLVTVPGVVEVIVTTMVQPPTGIV